MPLSSAVLFPRFPWYPMRVRAGWRSRFLMTVRDFLLVASGLLRPQRCNFDWLGGRFARMPRGPWVIEKRGCNFDWLGGRFDRITAGANMADGLLQQMGGDLHRANLAIGAAHLLGQLGKRSQR